MSSSFHSSSPFSLLEEDTDKINQRVLKVDHTQIKPLKKNLHMPFKPYEITDSDRKRSSPVKTQRVSLNQNPKKIQQGASDQKTGSLEKQKVDEEFDSPDFPKRDSSEDYLTDEEYEQQKYFLKKKQRTTQITLNSDGDPPILYDIGLEPEMIKDKMKLVLSMGQPDYDMIMNPDLAGPILIALVFGFLLLFSAQLHFGDIYALFLFGNFFLFMLFNFMAKTGIVPLYNIMSIIGYCLLPMLAIGMLGIIFRLQNFGGMLASVMLSAWSSKTAANFLSAIIRGKKNRNLLFMYPLFLFYLCFATMVIF